ncbi:hypothetical protein C9F11_36670 [Streptomyces sp. YIM 121038]|nr:hypothetical protein C9F11_36670 [Streptomyces sp. YIM 121038]
MASRSNLASTPHVRLSGEWFILGYERHTGRSDDLRPDRVVRAGAPKG